MSALDTLRPALMQLDDPVAPSLPMAVLHQEADNLLTWLSQGGFAKLAAIGMPADALETAQQALLASREAQTAWMLIWGGRKSDERKDAEARGAELRSHLVAASRWNLRHQPGAQATLDRIMEGSGLADLVQDLHDLAALIEANADAYQADATFDPVVQAANAKELAIAIAGGLATAFADGDKQAAKDLRDRAAAYLTHQLAELRAAGTYAYRGDEALKYFHSRYRRQVRRRMQPKPDDEPVT